MNIYELTGMYKVLEEGIALNPDDEALKEALAKINDDIETKAENYGKLIRNLEAELAGCKAEAKRFTDRAKTLENCIKNVKANLMWGMKETGKTKFKTSLFSFSVAKNGGLAPLELKVSAEELPAELQKVTIEANNDAIRKYINETGDFTYAVLKEKGEHLNIR